MFVIVSCRHCGSPDMCQPSIQFVPESDFDDGSTRPGDDVDFGMCDVVETLFFDFAEVL